MTLFFALNDFACSEVLGAVLFLITNVKLLSFLFGPHPFGNSKTIFELINK